MRGGLGLRGPGLWLGLRFGWGVGVHGRCGRGCNDRPGFWFRRDFFRRLFNRFWFTDAADLGLLEFLTGRLLGFWCAIACQTDWFGRRRAYRVTQRVAGRTTDTNDGATRSAGDAKGVRAPWLTGLTAERAWASRLARLPTLDRTGGCVGRAARAGRLPGLTTHRRRWLDGAVLRLVDIDLDGDVVARRGRIGCLNRVGDLGLLAGVRALEAKLLRRCVVAHLQGRLVRSTRAGLGHVLQFDL